MIPNWLRQIGQKFRNLDDAWSFWVNYGDHAGFEVRIKYHNKSKMDRKVTSCRYVRTKKGPRARDKRDHVEMCMRRRVYENGWNVAYWWISH